MAMTAYSRITMAIERLTTKGRHIGGFRRADDLGGPACLVGGLLEDRELYATTDGFYSPTITACEPTFIEALAVLGFSSWAEAFYWHDGIRTPRPSDNDVIARLEAGRDRIIHQEADKAQVDVQPEVAVMV